MARSKQQRQHDGATLAMAECWQPLARPRRRLQMIGVVFLASWETVCGLAGLASSTRATGPWDIAVLKQTPAAAWGVVSNNLRQVYYQNVPYAGHPTRVFAYCAFPTNGPAPYPAVLLVPGSGMGAVADWAVFWASRGYVALTMDLTGRDPAGPMPDGGPDQNYATMFGEFTDQEADKIWFYHAVAAVVRGHSLLAAIPEVDSRRIGVHGLSWGGSIACIVAGIDDRLAAAATAFGAGYLYEDSAWVWLFLRMDADQRARWIKSFDPASYLGGVTCPILFVNSPTDTYFPPNSFQHSYHTAGANATLSLRLGLSHGWLWAIPGADYEVNRFLDAALKQGPPLARLSSLRRQGDIVSVTYSSDVAISYARLYYTRDLGPWQKRSWTQEAAAFSKGSASAQLPAGRPLAYFLSLTDAQGATVTTPYYIAGYESNPNVLRITGIEPLQGCCLAVRGTKMLHHRLSLLGALDGKSWYELARDERPGEYFECVITNAVVNGALFLRMRDLDW